MKRLRISGLAALLACLIVTSVAAVAETGAATWAVTSLQPSSGRASSAFGVSGNTVVGYFESYDGVAHASMWRGASDFRELPGPAGAWAYGVSGESIVGVLGMNAVAWVGASNDYVLLNPSDSRWSFGLATYGARQAGSYYSPPTGSSHAAIWSGTAATLLDLHPAGYTDSTIRAMDASGEAGDLYLEAYGSCRAALWHGTAESAVDLHPAGAYASSAQAISNGKQGGYVQFERDGTYYPAVWSGTAESFVNFSAPGAPTDAGIIYGMDGNVQVGGARFLDGSGGATIWFGTPDSAFNLASLLSSDYTRSEARAVDIDEFGTIRVVGYAYNENYYLPNGTYYPRNEAMMWVLVPEPSPLAALVAGLAGLAGVRPRRRR